MAVTIMTETMEVPSVRRDYWEIYPNSCDYNPSIGQTVTITKESHRIDVTIFFLASSYSKFKFQDCDRPDSFCGRNINDSYIGCVARSDYSRYSRGDLIIFTNANILR